MGSSVVIGTAATYSPSRSPPDVSGLGAEAEGAFVVLLQGVGQPAGDAGDGEDRLRGVVGHCRGTAQRGEGEVHVRRRCVTAAAPAAASGEGVKPKMLKAPGKGGADDLKAIKGIGPGLEALLNEMGVFHFAQIAGWTGDEIAWVDQNLLRFKGRASRDNWVDQAKVLAEGGETEFSNRVAKGDVYD